MKRILFVNEDVNILSGLRRGLYSTRHEWHLEFVRTAEDGLRLIADTPVDVVVTDVQMSGMDGLQFLRHAKKACPQAVRIVLAGHTEQDQLARSFRSMHLFFSKPCDVQMLRRRIRHILSCGEKIRDRSLKALISRVETVPSLPILARGLQNEFLSPEPNIDEIAAIVSMDVGLSASVLHLANSGYFVARLPMSSPELAARWLGLETVRNFFITHGLCDSLDLDGFKHFDALRMWRDSVARGTAARALALAESDNAVFGDEAFSSGLLQDIGQVVLASILRRSYDDIVRDAARRGEPLWKVERETIGATHAEVGAYLLALWGLPESVLNAVRFHHSRAESGAELRELSTVKKG